jgi:hypothetical protein
MNKKIKQLATQAQLEHCVSHVRLEDFANQIIGECVLAILATDTRSMTYTTHDKDNIAGIISLVVDSVKNNFKDA